MKLFISYSNVDRAACRGIAARLAAAHDVWYDDKLTVGQQWQAAIDAQIESADAMVWLLTPESVQSAHCQEEIDLAGQLGKAIVPVLLQDNTPLPPDIKRVQIVDLSDGLDDIHILLNGLTVIERGLQDTERMQSTLSRAWGEAVLHYRPLVTGTIASIIARQLTKRGLTVHTLPVGGPAVYKGQYSPEGARSAANLFLLDDGSLTDPASVDVMEIALRTFATCIPIYASSISVDVNNISLAMVEILHRQGVQIEDGRAGLDADSIERLIQIIGQSYIDHPSSAAADTGEQAQSIPVAMRPSAGTHASEAAPVLFIGSGACAGPRRVREHLLEILSRTGTRVAPTPLADWELLDYFSYRFGRTHLITVLKRVLEGQSDEIPGPLAQVLALPFQTVISTCHDASLDSMMQRLGFRVVDRPEATPQVILPNERLYFKLVGSLESSDTAIVTQRDIEAKKHLNWRDSPSLNMLLGTRRLIFLGYDVNDPEFQFLYNSLISPLDRRGIATYILTSAATALPGIYTSHGLTIIPTDGDNIAGEIAPLVEPSARVIPTQANHDSESGSRKPYKFLDYYDESDSEIFFGRERETRQLLGRVLSSKLVLLYGVSGTGKTSLVNAGLIPGMRSEGFTCVTIRLVQDPNDALRAAIQSSLGWQENGRSGSISRQIAQQFMLRDGLKILLVFDQFEELFIHHGPDVIADFARDLGQLYDSPLVQVKILLSIREDYLPFISTLDSAIPDIFHNYMRLLPLSAKQALEAIVKPAQIHGVKYEEGLAEKIVSDLTFEGVEAPQLQIVCDQLFDLNIEGTIEAGAYQELGGSRGILGDYTSEVLRRFEPDKRPLVTNLLKHLVTIHGTKDNVALETLSHRFQASLADIQIITKALIRYRLLRPVDTLTGVTFELTHDYLAEEIRGWIADSEINEKAALHLLKQELETWQRHGTVMAYDRFKIVNEQRDRIAAQLTNDESAFCLHCSLNRDTDVESWLELNVGNAKAREYIELALQAADTGPPSSQLYSYAVGALEFQDLYETALVVLGKYGNPHLFPRLRTLIDSEAPEVASFGEQAMAAIMDRARGRMVYIKPQDCFVGTSQEEVDVLIDRYSIDPARLQDEAPKRKVRAGGFWIDKFSVTNAEYFEYDPQFTFPEGEENHPAVNLNFHHAQAYARWWGKELPTETEWECAARGSDGRRYTWGDDWDTGKCNTEELGLSASTPVDAFPDSVSPTGCWDMLGNVWEWVDSWFDERMRLKVCKGGGWAADQLWARCAARHRSFITSQFHLVGFRCVMRNAQAESAE